jgi:hypothetical protein
MTIPPEIKARAAEIELVAMFIFSFGVVSVLAVIRSVGT